MSPYQLKFLWYILLAFIGKQFQFRLSFFFKTKLIAFFKLVFMACNYATDHDSSSKYKNVKYIKIEKNVLSLKLEDAIELGEQLAHERSSLMKLSVEKDKEIVNVKLKLEKYDLIVKQFSQRVKKLKQVIRRLNHDDRYVTFSEAPHRQRVERMQAKRNPKYVAKSSSRVKSVERREDNRNESENEDNNGGDENVDQMYSSDFDDLDYDVNSELLN